MNSTSKAAPMNKYEAMQLVRLVAASAALTTKKTNATNNKRKEEAWRTITAEFNAKTSGIPRSSSQLRLKWENLKKNARKRSARIRSGLKTGGGKVYFPPDEVLDKVTSLLRSIQHTTPQHSSKSEATANVPLIEEGLVDGDEGLTNHSDNQILTPIPKPTNFFLNQASSTNTLVKRIERLEEEKCKARILRDNALADYLNAKKRKIDQENVEKEIVLAKLKVELENAKLENLKLRRDLNLSE
ncbi:uncharacterized protein LOC112053794 isoform X1 [Bicyclus anynana]|uniref:Regulatory protein zeste n=1 Tax=Bicyclus anynana TaxID=110368 RepID=A0A6J1NN21_BICAN|nr:uncharacterized protein LOC112053794 isoform X1 [Bicyclus anynana]